MVLWEAPYNLNNIGECMKSSKEFTLVELIVIVAVISILTSLLFSAVEIGMKTVRDKQCVDNLRNLGAITGSFMGDYGSLPRNGGPISFDDRFIAYDGRPNHPAYCGNDHKSDFGSRTIFQSTYIKICEEGADNYDIYMPYISELYVCPDDGRSTALGDGEVQDIRNDYPVFPRSYTVNGEVYPNRNNDDLPEESPLISKPVSISIISDLDETIWMAEAPLLKYNRLSGSNDLTSKKHLVPETSSHEAVNPLPHSLAYNFMMFDFSVRGFDPHETDNDDVNMWEID